MNESKIELTERLRREGRWAEASWFKDEIVKKLRAEGMKRREAGEQAWREMAKAFPPVVPPTIYPLWDDKDNAYGTAIGDFYDLAQQDVRQWQSDHDITLAHAAEKHLILMLLVPYWCAGTLRMAPDAWRRHWEGAEQWGGELVPS
ncbi:MAG: hypothetical protein ACYC4U_12820 [Pirellulaceae bacterium]